MSVSVALCAGLGNRMFQYASVKGIAAKHNLTFKVDSCEVCVEHGSTTYDWFMHDVLGLHDVPAKTVQQVIDENPGRTWRESHETHIGYSDISKEDVDGKVVIASVLQSDKFFRHIEDEIRRDFKEPAYITHIITNWLEQIKIPIQNNNLCIMHFRLGDFLSHGSYEKHFINLTDYYKYCLSQIGPYDPIIIITEEPNKVELVYPEVCEILRRRSAPVYIAPLLPQHCECFHMYLMSYAKTVVCANSTFAWWGAWLNNREDKTVFFPSRVINGIPRTIDMEGAVIVDV